MNIFLALKGGCIFSSLIQRTVEYFALLCVICKTFMMIDYGSICSTHVSKLYILLRQLTTICKNWATVPLCVYILGYTYYVVKVLT